MVDKQCNILSLDGGGVRGLITVHLLAAIERKCREILKDPHYKITQSVDLIIGTSAGGLLALALGCGYGANELIETNIMSNIIEATFKTKNKYFYDEDKK
jgi:patatin-like phospholipase/acyl hydrolase